VIDNVHHFARAATTPTGVFVDLGGGGFSKAMLLINTAAGYV
jgi:hypothetical protein